MELFRGFIYFINRLLYTGKIKKKINELYREIKIFKPNPIRILFHNNDCLSSFTKALSEIDKINKKARILVLGRNRKDIDKIKSKMIKITDDCIFHKQFPEMVIEYKTVHQSKGLESDFVILISAENAKNGFPNKMEDDPILCLLLGEESDFEFAEERRLFYVALTRTRSIVYILSDKNKPSIFVDEINRVLQVKYHEEKETLRKIGGKCPYCKGGKLILRGKNEGNESFYGCSNYPYCTYKINDLIAVQRGNCCPVCGDFLVIRKGSFGRFMGCHSYPYCTYKRNINI